MVDKGASSPSSVIECDRVYYRAGEMTDLVNLWTTGPYLHCCGHLARLPCISLPQRHLRARSPLVPPRKAKRDAARGLAVAAAADIPGRPYGEQLCLPRLFVRGVRRRVRQLRVSCVLDTPRPYLDPSPHSISHPTLSRDSATNTAVPIGGASFVRTTRSIALTRAWSCLRGLASCCTPWAGR